MSGSPRFWAGWCKLVRLNYEKEEYSLADYDSIIPNNYLFKEDIADAVVFDRVQAGYEFCRHGAHLTLNSFRKNEPMFIYISKSHIIMVCFCSASECLLSRSWYVMRLYRQGI